MPSYWIAHRPQPASSKRLEVVMAEQEQKKPQPAPDSKTETEDVVIEKKSSEATEKLDDLLDEIDSVLEENAEEFVKNYVQKGGE